MVPQWAKAVGVLLAVFAHSRAGWSTLSTHAGELAPCAGVRHLAPGTWCVVRPGDKMYEDLPQATI